MNAGTWPARKVVVEFTHPAMEARPFMPLVHRAMREFEQHGTVAYPNEVDGAGNFITRFQSTEGVDVVMRSAPRGGPDL